MREPKFSRALRCLQKELQKLYEEQGRYNLAVQKAAVQEDIGDLREAIRVLEAAAKPAEKETEKKGEQG